MMAGLNLQILLLIVAQLVGFYLLYWILRAVYRLYAHPLRRYPGPWVAKVSKPWYEWYHNFYHKGQLLFEIERLHNELGPIIRIAPNELHINDPAIYLEITKVGSNFGKDPEFYNFVMFPGTSVAESNPSLHRIRRAVLAPAFSPSAVQSLSPMIKAKTDQVLTRFEEFASRSEPVNISRATKAFTMDVISSIVLGPQTELGRIQDPEFRNEFIEYLHSTFDMGWTATAFPNLTRLSLGMPEWLAERLLTVPIMEFKKKCATLISEYLYSRISSGFRKTEDEGVKKSAVIDMLVAPNSAKHHSALNASQLAEEVIMLLSAGTDTTSDAMIVGIYQILRNPEITERLVEELMGVFPDIEEEVTWEKVRGLKYLTAVVKETLRYSNPLPGRAPRVVPKEGFVLYGHKLPAGTVINTSAYLLNRHPSIWSEPEKFLPERWLESEKEGERLDKYMASFYRGSRGCLGKDLALCEMYTLIANLFRHFELQIHDTTDADMKWIDLLFTYFTDRDFHVSVKKRAV